MPMMAPSGKEPQVFVVWNATMTVVAANIGGDDVTVEHRFDDVV